MPLLSHKKQLSDSDIEKLRDKYCPICAKRLKVDQGYVVAGYYEFDCRITHAVCEHFYIIRVNDEANEQVVKVKFRIGDICVRINFDEGTSEMWILGTPKGQRVTVSSVFWPDFSDIEKIKTKIKTLLTFS